VGDSSLGGPCLRQLQRVFGLLRTTFGILWYLISLFHLVCDIPILVRMRRVKVIY